MTIWLIEPRDPLIFRDGRPFNADPGARAQTLPFPFPSTISGALRAQAGRNAQGRFDKSRISELLKLEVEGPLLVELDDADEMQSILYPAPADAWMLKLTSHRENAARLVPLIPIQLPEGASSNLEDLALVGPEEPVEGKPHPKAPAFWHEAAFFQWLKDPNAAEEIALDEVGLPNLPKDTRMHVRIDPVSQSAEEGALFQTSGLSFALAPVHEKGDVPRLSALKRLGLAVHAQASLRPDWGFVGGERRMAHWRRSNKTWPVCPDEVRVAIKKTRRARLILLTPAIFEQGFLPSWVLKSVPGVDALVKAAAVNRYQTVSGWDYEKQSPKPTRRLAPAGSVYFIELDGDDDAIDRFVDAVWMHNISDDPQDRLDGFGLAVLGVWNGQKQEKK